MKFTKFKAAAVIASPVLFDLDATIDKCCQFIQEASDHGAELVVFPETFLPLYPWWIWMGINNTRRLDLYKKLFKSSVDIMGKSFCKIRERAKEKEIYVMMGINERDAMTLYNTQVFISHKGEIIGKRRKLVPTGEERTVWGRGDGSDLVVWDVELGKIGGLICYENSMTLSRYALYTMGEEVHVANWPGANYRSQPRDRNRIIDLVSRFIAFEGQVFVIVSSSCLGEEEVEFYYDLDPANREIMETGGGVAGIISPLGEYVSEPLKNKEGIVYGDIDLEKILDCKHLLDTVGHYARPDVTTLLINQQKNRPMVAKSCCEEKFYHDPVLEYQEILEKESRGEED